MKKLLIGGLLAVILVAFVVLPSKAVDTTTILVSNLQPSWTAHGGGGVYSAYYGPPDYNAVSPGTTEVINGKPAGIIKAGQGNNPGSSNWDQGLFAFQPNMTINELANSPLTYDVENQYGVNPVWMTIEIDTGVVGDRTDNKTYQFIPTSYGTNSWTTVNAGIGKWQLMTSAGNGTGDLMTLSEIAAENNNVNVVRVYLRLGMGDSYYSDDGNGTVGWVNNVTIGNVTYDFVTMNQCKNGGWKNFGTLFKNQGDCISYISTLGKNLPVNP